MLNVMTKQIIFVKIRVNSSMDPQPFTSVAATSLAFLNLLFVVHIFPTFYHYMYNTPTDGKWQFLTGHMIKHVRCLIEGKNV